MAKNTWSADDKGIASTLRRSQRLYLEHGQALGRHAQIPGLLDHYRQAIDQTARLTLSLGVPAFCGECARKQCLCCFEGVERQYDEYLLLINHMMGANGQREAGVEAVCHFCGPAGCCLVAKHSFCLNYYCQDIQQALGQAGAGNLRGLVGAELQCQWELDRVLMPWLWSAAKASGQG
jgi:hypothetical protein